MSVKVWKHLYVSGTKTSFEHYRLLKKSKRKRQNDIFYQHSKQKKTIEWKPVSKEAQRKRRLRETNKQLHVHEEETRKRKSAYQKTYRAKTSTCTDDIQITSTCIPSFANRMQKHRDIKRLKESLPETPIRRASVISSYLTQNSPTIKTLEKLKVIRSPEEIADNSIETSVLHDIKDILHKTRKSRSDENIQSRNVIFAAISGEEIQKTKCKTQLAQKLGVEPRRMACGKRVRTRILVNEESSWKLTLKRTRSNKISEEIKKSVYEFWLSSGVSRPTGCKKHVKRERLAPHVFVSRTIQVLEVTQTDAYQQFRRAFPDMVISQRSFEKLKPFYVRPVRQNDRQTCMCRYHVEISTVLKHCMTHRKKVQDERNADDETKKSFPVFPNVNTAINSTLCEKSDFQEYYKTECLNRSCEACGVPNFKLMPEETSTEEMVKWERFEYVSIPSKGNTMRKKLMLVQKVTCVKDMYSYLVHLLASFPAHQFRALWQNRQLKVISTTLPLRDVVCLHDFSENYRQVIALNSLCT